MFILERLEKIQKEKKYESIRKQIENPSAIGAAIKNFLNAPRENSTTIDIYEIFKDLTVNEIFGAEYQPDEILLNLSSEQQKIEEVRKRFEQIDAAFYDNSLYYEDIVEILGSVPVEYLYKTFRSMKKNNGDKN